MRIIPALFLGALFFSGCDYVDDPTPPAAPGGNNGGETVKRRALLEEFTGHRCPTCPAAHAIAANLADVYGEDMILVGIHATDFFAAPLDPPAPNGSYSTDFRTVAGEAYATAFNIMSLPTGTVSRAPFNSAILISKDNWSSAIADIIAQDAALDLWIDTIIHDGIANTVTTTVKAAILQPITGDHNVTVYLTEDHVIDWQVNASATPSDIEFYDHRHVLRTNLNGTWGDLAIFQSAAVGDTLVFQLDDRPMDPSWNAANCELVAYVYNVATNEVLQAAERGFEP